MKRILLFSSLFFAVASAVAAVPVEFTAKTPLRIVKAGVSMKLAPATTQIITAMPEGERMAEVTWSSRACHPENNKVVWSEVSGFVPTIITAGADMYIYSPLTGLSELAQAWIKGEIAADGKSVTFPTPQAYMINEATPGMPVTLYATRVSSTTGRPEEGNTNLIFTYDDEGNLVQTDGGLLALTDLDGNFYGYGDMDIAINKIKDKPVVLPAAAEAQTFVMSYKSGQTEARISARIAVYGDDIYFSDPLGIVNSWFKGVQEGDKVTVSTPQYMGAGSGYPLYLVTGKAYTRTETDPIMGSYEVTDYTVNAGEDIVFTFDEETGVYSSAQLLLLSSSPDKKGDATAPFMSPLYTPWQAIPVTPATPSVTFYLDLKDYEAYGVQGVMLTCEIPSAGVDGEFIPQENVFYQLSFDGTPLQFYGASIIPYYAQFQETATLTAVTVSGDTHQIQTMYKPTKSVELQSFYEYEGQMIPSEKAIYRIVDGQLEGASVDTVESEIISSESYYDVTGRRVSPATEGIVIRRCVTADGKIRSEKILNTRAK